MNMSFACTTTVGNPNPSFPNIVVSTNGGPPPSSISVQGPAPAQHAHVLQEKFKALSDQIQALNTQLSVSPLTLTVPPPDSEAHFQPLKFVKQISLHESE